ncbi:MAG: hypothetical protein ABWY11_12450 [Umezawaea sp.]
MTIMIAGVLGGCGQRPAATSQETPVSSTGASSPVRVPAPTRAPGLKEQIDAARQARLETVVLTISTLDGRTASTARALRDLGATVESEDAAVGYVRARVPVALAAQAATLGGISRVDLEDPVGNTDPTP